ASPGGPRRGPRRVARRPPRPGPGLGQRPMAAPPAAASHPDGFTWSAARPEATRCSWVASGPGGLRSAAADELLVEGGGVGMGLAVGGDVRHRVQAPAPGLADPGEV